MEYVDGGTLERSRRTGGIGGVPDALAATIDACLAADPVERPTLPHLAAALVPLAPGARAWDA